jgi:hypothetical protein
MIVTDEERPISLFDSSPGDEESDTSPVDLRRDAGDWLERRADLPRAPTPGQPSARLWPLLAPRNPLHSLQRRLPRVAGVSNLMSAEHGLRIFPAPLPAIELEGSPIPTEEPEPAPEPEDEHENDTQEHTDENRDQRDGSTEIDEDESALAVAIEVSLRTQNRYTANGTNLEELRQALANSVLDD